VRILNNDTLKANFFFSVILILIPSPCFSSFFTLKNAIETARKESPDIRSLRNQMYSAAAKKRQTLAPSEPSLSVTYNDLDSAFDVPNSGSTVYMLTQPLAFPGKALVNHAVASHQEKSIEFQLHAKELEVSTNVETAYYNLALAEKNIELNSEQKASYERILAIAKRRYESGAITQVDFLNAQIALYSNQNDLLDLKAAEKTARAQLNTLLSLDVEAPTEVRKIEKVELKEPYKESEAQKKMFANRPEIQSAHEQAQAIDSSYTLAKMSFLPDFQLVAGTTNYNLAGASPLTAANPNSRETYLLGVQATIPLWFFFNERESIVAASHDSASAEANVATLNNQSKVALETSLATLSALKSKIENYENHLLPLSEQSFNIALVSYSSGKIDFQSLADTATSRRGVKKDYYNLIVNYLTGYASLNQLLGEDISD